MSQYGYLAHHGIKGQKWGIRRYQNADGSLTAQGKARYLTSDGKWTSTAKKETSLLDRARYEKNQGMRPGEIRGPLTSRHLNKILNIEQNTADINKNGYHNLAGIVTNRGTVSIGLKKDKTTKLNPKDYYSGNLIKDKIKLHKDLNSKVNKDGYHNITGFVSTKKENPGYRGIGIKVDKGVIRDEAIDKMTKKVIKKVDKIGVGKYFIPDDLENSIKQVSGIKVKDYNYDKIQDKLVSKLKKKGYTYLDE